MQCKVCVGVESKQQQQSTQHSKNQDADCQAVVAVTNRRGRGKHFQAAKHQQKVQRTQTRFCEKASKDDSDNSDEVALLIHSADKENAGSESALNFQETGIACKRRRTESTLAHSTSAAEIQKSESELARL